MIETSSYTKKKIQDLAVYSIHNMTMHNIPITPIKLEPTNNNLSKTVLFLFLVGTNNIFFSMLQWQMILMLIHQSFQ